MGTIIHNVTQFYHYVNDDLADPRVNGVFMATSPFPLLILMVVYHRFVRSWGPAFMEKRQPYNLRNLIIVYNVVQIVLCVFLAQQCIVRLYMSGYYSMWCQKIIVEETPLEMVVLSRVHLYYMVKVLDLLDTVFFVLRKKYNQASFLHVYHHLGMCCLGYIGSKYLPGGHGVMLGCVNSIVHAVMYTYYLIAITRKEWVRSWWKKYITQMQILQFLMFIFHFGHVLFEPSCGYPKWVSFAFLPHNIFMLFLFSDFYIKSYMKKKAKAS